MKKSLLTISSLVMGVIMSFAQVTSITVEEYFTDNGMVSGYPAGHTTYRIYANCTNQNDVVASVFGNSDNPLSLVVTGSGVWNHPGGGVNGPALNCSLYGLIPALEYDSYVTIGRTCNADAGSTVYSVEDPAQLWQDELFNTMPYGASSLILNTTVGGAWFGLPGDVNAFAGEDLKVLIAQVTTDGTVCGSINIQCFPNWDSAGDPYVIQNLNFGECGEPGCTDPLALNYDSNAGFDNGICLYECGIDFTAVDVVQPTCSYNEDGSIFFSADGGQDFIQYFFNGEDGGLSPDTYTNLGNGVYTITIHDTRFDSPLFNPGGVYSCTVSQEIELNTAEMVFSGLSSEPVSCGGEGDGCASAEFTGGTGTITFNIWECEGDMIPGDLATADYCGLSGGDYQFSATDENGCLEVSSCVEVIEPATLNLFIGASSDASCFNTTDGVQVASWGGGTGDVDFSLENDGVFDIEGNLSNVILNDLAPGVYVLYAADDNGCQDNAEFEIGAPAAIEIIATVGEPSCNGDANGVLTIEGQGGTGDIELSFDNETFSAGPITLTDLAAGMYMAYAVDAEGCSVESEIELTEPAVLGVSAAVTNISCFGESDGSVEVVTSGGTAPFQYSLNGESYSNDALFTGLGAGPIDVYAVDANGCTSSSFEAGTVEEPSQVTVTITGQDISCNGAGDGMIMAAGSGGTGDFTYSINDGPLTSNGTFDDLDAGDYDVLAVDENGCEAMGSATIDEPTAIVITGLGADPIDETPGGNTDYTVSGGTPGYTYEWVDGNGDVVSTSEDLDDLTSASDAGDYTLTVTDANGCTETQEIVITGLSELGHEVVVSVVPNPTLGEFAINFEGLAGMRVSFTINDATGRQIMYRDLGIRTGVQRETLDITGQAAGIYYINLLVGDVMETYKLIKQ